VRAFPREKVVRTIFLLGAALIVVTCIQNDIAHVREREITKRDQLECVHDDTAAPPGAKAATAPTILFLSTPS
jgi:hypothetical protein